MSRDGAALARSRYLGHGTGRLRLWKLVPMCFAGRVVLSESDATSETLANVIRGVLTNTGTERVTIVSHAVSTRKICLLSNG